MANVNRKSERVGTKAASAKGKATQSRIFRAATKEFAEKGFAGARIDTIATEAGVNKQRIYAYFGDKEGLFIEIWKRTFELIYEEDKEFLSLSDEDIPNLGQIILKSYMEFHDRHPEFWRIFVMENLFGGRHGRPGHTRDDKPYGRIRDLYAKGQDRGLFRRDVSFDTFIFVLTGVSYFYASNRSTMSDNLGIDLSDGSVRERMVDEMCLMLFGNSSPS